MHIEVNFGSVLVNDFCTPAPSPPPINFVHDQVSIYLALFRFKNRSLGIYLNFNQSIIVSRERILYIYYFQRWVGGVRSALYVKAKIIFLEMDFTFAQCVKHSLR